MEMAKDYIANPKDAERVKNCVRAGIIDPERIGKIIQVSKKDIERCYPYELGVTDDEDLAIVANVAFDMAISGKFPHMTLFWLRQKGGPAWQENKQEAPSVAAPITIIMKHD